MMIPSIGFKKALPVWIKGYEQEMNVQVGFVLEFDAFESNAYTLLLTGSTLYRVFVNQCFVHYGPARGPHGFARLDSLDLKPHLREGRNRIAIEVAGYNCDSYYTLNQPSFLQAELLDSQGNPIYSTAPEGPYRGIRLTGRVQEVMRYSFQRSFSEVYILQTKDPSHDWINGISEQEAAVLAVVDWTGTYLPREVPIPRFELTYPTSLLEHGKVEVLTLPDGFQFIRHRFIHEISEESTGYPLEQISERPFETLQTLTFYEDATRQRPISGSKLLANEYVLLDMGLNNNGFIGSEIVALEDSEVYFIFDEKLIEGRIDYASWESINILKYSLEKRSTPYTLESFESYGFRYIQCVVLKGEIQLQNLWLREYSYPRFDNAEFFCSDDEINTIYKAAIETYRQNTLDVFMDCATRERAGWLCDSYFTAQSAQFFSGESKVEKVMLENYVLAAEFSNLPQGMLPMCYPADHVDGNFIPQWAMWYVIELEGYLKRSAEAKPDYFRSLCYDLLHYLSKFKNSDGLLENLEKWNFIEWSQANQWVRDVNYPTNMLYCQVLRLIGSWYEDEALLQQSELIKQIIIEQSFDGTFFVDQALRAEDGSLVRTENRSEVCQYYALFFQIADVQDARFSKLKHTVLEEFGPERKQHGSMPEIAYANSFVGNYLRLEILLRWRRYQQVMDECKGYFYKMAVLTGTLWEHDRITYSLNHGFASYAGVAIIRSLLGIQEIDERQKIITLDFIDMSISKISGKVGSAQGVIEIDREVVNGESIINYSIPEGYELRWIDGQT